MHLFCGIDWSEQHHDVAVVDDTGALRARAKVPNDPSGLRTLLALLADCGDSAEQPIPVAIERPDGLLVASLRVTGRPVFAINPLSVSRYRDRHSLSGKKSDSGDALVLAHVLRTDLPAHRPLPADSDLAQAIAVLARAQQDAVWDRQQLGNRLRSLLLDYYPAAVAAFSGLSHGGLTRPDARAVLRLAPSPARAATLTRRQLLATLTKAGRVRLVSADVERLHQLFREPQLRLPAVVEAAFARQLRALLRQLDAACAAQDELTAAVEDAFAQHPDAAVLTSFPGVSLVGARLLAEIGDDRTRFADARALKAYAGSAPVTRASGRSTVVSARRIKNQRLAATGYVWAFASLRPSSGARAHYDRRRATGDRHTQALRNLTNRLHDCLQTGNPYAEQRAFPAPTAAA